MRCRVLHACPPLRRPQLRGRRWRNRRPAKYFGFRVRPVSGSVTMRPFANSKFRSDPNKLASFDWPIAMIAMSHGAKRASQ